ncbi:glycerol-3-phosphate dehydrogenase/oxidase [Massilia sp. TS11]|uniref:glycerol-3-phosphate dehydrogenase/oxidase n=1 Tax=Massilia sp. TS11 TaxID=2908003 RepID=UPI001EDC7916|nr:glycerol-3-phosphate dehydrogenase/oxidase [Massilia sp. TS11]MCG2583299.1 glycerol-3-phosphate dehydrogenase/oxidase [Massilia sp. TS11]
MRRPPLSELARQPWDLLVIGGGITGAGIVFEAARRGLRALLVEQRDFAWGTSSRSSKLVHGGLRYLKQGQLHLTRESVRERQALMRSAPGLVQAQGFAFGDYADGKMSRRLFLLGLAIYDWLGGLRERHYLALQDFLMLAPNVARGGLLGGMRYTDAKTDDARLVLRVLQEARAAGASVINYVAADALVRDAAGRVAGARLRDVRSGEDAQVAAAVVINATGAWAERLGSAPQAGLKLRPLRGSHLVLPAWRLPLAQAVSLMHPADGRPVFAYPWEGATLVGTTDVDHGADLQQEARITRAELDYLLAALRHQFPQLALGEDDVLASFAGVRPVLDSGQADPSKETREHALWLEPGLLTVAGGKLTTFRVIALDVLRRVASQLPHWHGDLRARPVFERAPVLRDARGLGPQAQARLLGRYGAQAQDLIDAAAPDELEPIPGTETLWAELRWAARHEDVQQLDDLLLRRTRLGLLLRAGGAAHAERLRAICQPELGWSAERWAAEWRAYLALCEQNYSLPKVDDHG